MGQQLSKLLQRAPTVIEVLPTAKQHFDEEVRLFLEGSPDVSVDLAVQPVSEASPDSSSQHSSPFGNCVHLP